MFIDPLESRVMFAAGDFDPYFGNGGVAESDRLVTPASDGRIYLMEQFGAFGRSATIRRLDANGQLDSSFNVALNPTKDYSTAETREVPPAVDSRGRIFVAIRGGIICLGPNGKVDPTFGNRGVIASPLEYSVTEILVLRDDRILLAGSQRKLNGTDEGDPFFGEAAAIARLNTNGALDQSFGTNGVHLASTFTVYRLQRPASNSITDIAIDSSDRIIALRKLQGGQEFSDRLIQDTTYDVIALNPDGSEDSSFVRAAGATQFETHNDFFNLSATLSGRPAEKLVTDSSNRIIVSLGHGDPDTEHAGILRVLPNGALDTSFGGGDGFVEEFFTEDRINFISSVFTVASGKVFFAAQTRSLSGRNTSAVMIALNSDGSRDTTFGSNGIAGLGLHRTPLFAGLARDGSILINTGGLRRLWRDGAPAAIASVKNISVANRSVVIDVAYRDDGAIDTSTLDNHDLRISGPNGYAKYARFDSIVSSTNNNGMVVARYKLPALGGSWAGRNGTYDVRLRGDQVRDTEGSGAASRSIATFMVNVAGASSPASLRGLATQTIQRDDVFSGVSLAIDERL